MNHSVPDFEIDDDYSSPPSSVLTRPRKSAMVEDDVMELLWQNGQVVLQSQSQRSLKRQSQSRVDDAVIPADHQSAPREIVSPPHHHRQNQDHFFMQEDEMASWLHYPLNDTNFDSDFCADLLYPSATCVTSTSSAPTATTTTTTPIHTAQVTESRPLNTAVSASASASRPPIPPLRRTDNFTHFSRHKPRATEISGPSNSKSVVVRESTVVNSSDTPAFAPESRLSETMRSTEGASGGNISGGVAATSSAGGGGATDLATCEMTVTSSTGGSSASEEPAHKPAAEDRKRKGREAADDEYNYNSEDVELEFADAKKQNRGSTSAKRSRAAEVHNLSERRRRDRINEKMKALQELIPRCNKSDKASMLDEAIEYLKSLQLQVQMMSMGCGMVPMMFPGIQQYIPNMGMAMGMGMGMGMEMGMNRPMIPFPNIVACSPLSTPAATAHLGPPRFPMPAYMQPVPPHDPSRVQANNNQPDPMLNSFGMQNQNPNQPRVANFVDPYQQYRALHQMQLPVVQNQSTAQASSSKPSTSKGPVNPKNHPSG